MSWRVPESKEISSPWIQHQREACALAFSRVHEAVREIRHGQIGRAWNPLDLGYVASYAMRVQIEGTLKPGATEFEAGKLGKIRIINGSQILLGPPHVFTKDDIEQFNF